MKFLILKFGTAILNVLYGFMKLLPVHKKIVYLSRQQDTTPLDFELIIAQMEHMHPEYRNIVLARRIPNGSAGKIGYCFFILKQMYHIATAEAAVLDTYCIPICVLKQRKSLKVIQIWHALGAFKKFSYSIIDKPEGRSSSVAKAMHMHENYTWVLTSSEYCRPYFQEAFRALPEQMRVIPLPRADYITDPATRADTRTRIFARYPKLQGTEKKILVYAPTFRKIDVDFQKAIDDLIEAVDFERYELIIKVHPLSDIVVRDQRVIQDCEFVTHEILQVTDACITDYSAVLFEAALLELPIYFYTFDFKEYMNGRDFYLDFDLDLPGKRYAAASDLLNAIERKECSREEVARFRDRMIERTTESSAERIVKLMTGRNT